MINKIPVLKGVLFLIGVVLATSVLAQTPMPNYYYANKQPRALKGVSLQVSPYSKPLLGLEETFKPSFLDVSVGYTAYLIPGYYKSPFAVEFYLFGNFASYKPAADSMLFGVYKNDKMVDYGIITFTNMSLFRGGAQVMFWNNTVNKLQLGPGFAVSVGKYKYDYSGHAAPPKLNVKDSTLFSGSMDHEFVMFTPCFAAKYWFKDNLGFTLSVEYNMIFETKKKGPELDAINSNLSKAYATITPRVGVFYTFKKR